MIQLILACLDLKVEYFIGGTPLDFDVLKCKECQVAIGAPGRIKHLVDLGELKTGSIHMLVLDEVDALLSNREFAIQFVFKFFIPLDLRISVNNGCKFFAEN